MNACPIHDGIEKPCGIVGCPHGAVVTVAARDSADFVKFALLDEAAQTAAIRGRRTLHVEPVMVRPSSGPDANKSMGVYHLQLGTQHTVFTRLELAEFLAVLEVARERVKKWESEGSSR